MIIKRLIVRHLHGIYNYDVRFNNELTFIYGENGCGKTTVIDIVSSIVTGRLYNLFAYNFDEIQLFYSKTARSKQSILSVKSENDSYIISLNNDEMVETIEDVKNVRGIISRDDNEYSLERRFINTYKFPIYLKRTFNYIYLPLSRNSQDGMDINDTSNYRRRPVSMYSEKDLVNKNYLNDSLRYVQELVRNACMRISLKENTINSKFRSNLLTSSLKVTSEYDIMKLLRNDDKNAMEDIERSKDEYIKTLKSIAEWNAETAKQVDIFFNKYKVAYDKFRQETDEGKSKVTVDLLLMNIEFNKIKDIASQAQRIETEKEIARASKTTLLSIVNDFLSMGEDKKMLSIDEEGRIVVKVSFPQRTISMFDLSSGEKQIIIIFACLIFGLESNQNGIYIVDEPEASLHLAWQKHFVESIRKINNNIQLIFATHAPEIIGRYGDHSIKLIKKVDATAIEDDTYED